jgi:hypothetical protein
MDTGGKYVHDLEHDLEAATYYQDYSILHFLSDGCIGRADSFQM